MNLDVIERYCNAWRRGDITELHASYHDDFMLHYPARHALSGDHKGKEMALRVLAQVSQRMNRTLIQIVDAMAGKHRSAIIVREKVERNGMISELNRVLVYAIKDDRLHECWLHDYEQDLFACFVDDNPDALNAHQNTTTTL